MLLNIILFTFEIYDILKSFLCLLNFIKDSGVHGALVVLEPSFTGESMATALGIPPAKHMIRRHLAAELEALVLPARYSVYCHPDANPDNVH